MRRGAQSARAAAVILSALCLVGCAATTPPVETNSAPTTLQFTGPYAEEFKANYESSSSDFVRAVLSDSQVTDQEYSEMRSAFSNCLSASGISIEFKEDGSFTTKSPTSMSNDTSHANTVRCSKESGEDLIGSLYSFVHRNPERLDENTIMAACLVRQKVVTADYDSKDFARDSVAGDFTFTDPTNGQKALETCSADPLDLLGQQ